VGLGKRLLYFINGETERDETITDGEEMERRSIPDH
jgi:hypothetical protein